MKQKKTAVIIAVVLAVALACGGGYMYIQSENAKQAALIEQQEAEEKAEAERIAAEKEAAEREEAERIAAEQEAAEQLAKEEQQAADNESASGTESGSGDANLNEEPSEAPAVSAESEYDPRKDPNNLAYDGNGNGVPDGIEGDLSGNDNNITYSDGITDPGPIVGG